MYVGCVYMYMYMYVCMCLCPCVLLHDVLLSGDAGKAGGLYDPEDEDVRSGSFIMCIVCLLSKISCSIPAVQTMHTCTCTIIMKHVRVQNVAV